MKGERSEATLRAELLAEAILTKAKVIAEAIRIPLGMEKVSPGEYKRRWKAMGREQRLEEINRLGVDEVYKLIYREEGESA